MSTKNGLLNVFAAAMLASLSHAACANTPVGNLVTGQVTGVSGGDHVSINGRVYAVKASSPASNTLPQIKVGQTVDVVLDNPPSSSLAQVVVIHVH
jgi:hypothetical protein